MNVILTTLHLSLYELTVSQFIQYMTELGAQDDEMSIPAFRNGNCFVHELLSVSFGRARARCIPCSFYGGPPKGHSVYRGTLLTMFIDRLLTAALANNFMVLDKYLTAPKDMV